MKSRMAEENAQNKDPRWSSSITYGEKTARCRMLYYCLRGVLQKLPGEMKRWPRALSALHWALQ